MHTDRALSEAEQATRRQALAVEIEQCGFYPELVLDSIEMALAHQPLLGHLVHHEATFLGSDIHRHMTVLALTPNRLLVSHTDEQQAPGGVQAISSVEAVALERVHSVVLTRVLQHPERFAQGESVLYETWLTLGWGAIRKLDLEPASCPDPECSADHGYTGTQTVDDFTVRMSQAADGAASSQALVDFASLLQSLTCDAR